MGLYYLDIETTGIDPKKDKIISIQYQKIDSEGKESGDFVILKEWDFSEREIVERFYKEFFDGKNVFYFIPVGYNLSFEFCFLFEKFRKYVSNFKDDISFFRRPHVDLRQIIVFQNGCCFKGTSLDEITKKYCKTYKENSGNIINGLYKSKNFEAIEKYIINEKNSFLELFCKYRCFFKSINFI